ncbi:double-strand break repair helicase AddA [Fodinicurvata fenggangensis]|uniref:double-strand break repair helicase AddA n=1 Tax=Fodinicurvata fenggangensis TaxID=1121830 RepID=UPI00068DE115|nr:double-strand break repair helicase AddA [Fodinicurvata fenggangensis]
MSGGTTHSAVAQDRQQREQGASQRQRQAADPRSSAWVTASAGTGKTKVLTDRVLNLLLDGTPPNRIVCLTFTKAAAAEMRIRLARTLKDWATARPDKLEEALHALGHDRPAPDLILRARQLFAAVLDAPGGIKIQTIHGFCQALLGRFPLEAGIAPHFRLVEERGQQDLLNAAREEVLAALGRPGEDALSEAIDQITALVGEEDFQGLVDSLIRERDRLARLLADLGSEEALLTEVARALEVEGQGASLDFLESACRDASFAADELRQAANALMAGSKSDAKRGEVLASWLAQTPESRARDWETYLGVFFTTTGTRREKLAHKEALAVLPTAASILESEALRVEALQESVRALRVAEATSALLRLGLRILDTYEREKTLRGLMDYEDLILKSRDLLSRPGISPWVLYKLDGGIDHFLVDEAQDTNPEQWEIVRLITADFFAGDSGHETAAGLDNRTVFAVGDAKQSIYSFQRAEPAAFARMQAYFAEKARSARKHWASVDLIHSFRSCQAVLDLVDAVFESENMHAGVTFGRGWLPHDAVRVGQAGRVELWPPVSPREQDSESPWDLPLNRQEDDQPRARLASLLASRIQSWTAPAGGVTEGDEAWLDARARPVAPGDILVLVRRRNAFVNELVRELKARNVPVAGVDRMVLTDQMAVMDLMALGQFLLLPEDDLNLAVVLRSPLIGLSEEQLFQLAWNRPGEGSLWRQLRHTAEADPALQPARDTLEQLLSEADYRPPYEFYADLLARGGRQRLLARLGPDAADPLEEFLSLALAYESEHTPSLQGFLHWMESGEREIKRDLESDGGAVRIMTVHGAKGLQAPIVILPDTMQYTKPNPNLLWLEQSQGATLPVWLPRKSMADSHCRAALETAEQQAEEEHRRLLYVALTRAEDRLYICGWETQRTTPETCWYKLVEPAMEAAGAKAVEFDFTTEVDKGWSGPGWRLDTPGAAPPDQTRDTPRRERPSAELPDWLLRPPPAEAEPPRPLTPSRPTQDDPPPRSPLQGSPGRIFRHGRLVHSLLEHLPDLPLAERRQAGLRFLGQSAFGLDETERQEILEETLAVLDTPAFADFFGPDSRAEVPITGLVRAEGHTRVISGQIDRLAVRAEDILVLDYKTNRPPPLTPEQVPTAYLRQMAAYAQVLSEVYPGRSIRCALLWTDGPNLMELPSELLTGHAP